MPKCCCCCSCCAFANFIAKFCYYWPQKKTTKSRSRTRKQRNGTVAMKHSGLNGKRKKLFLFHRNEKKHERAKEKKQMKWSVCKSKKCLLKPHWFEIQSNTCKMLAISFASTCVYHIPFSIHLNCTFSTFHVFATKMYTNMAKNNNSRHKFCCFFVFVSKWLSQFQITTPMSMCLCGCVSVSTFSLTVYLLHKFVVEWFKNADHIFQRQLKIAFALFVNGQNIEIF